MRERLIEEKRVNVCAPERDRMAEKVAREQEKERLIMKIRHSLRRVRSFSLL